MYRGPMWKAGFPPQVSLLQAKLGSCQWRTLRLAFVVWWHQKIHRGHLRDQNQRWNKTWLQRQLQLLQLRASINLWPKFTWPSNINPRGREYIQKRFLSMTTLGLELLIWSFLNLRDDLKSPSLHLKCNEASLHSKINIIPLSQFLCPRKSFYTQKRHSTFKKVVIVGSKKQNIRKYWKSKLKLLYRR